MQSRVVVDLIVDGMVGGGVGVGIVVVVVTELNVVPFVELLNTTVVVALAVVLGIDVVGHGWVSVTILQEALQNATKQYPMPSVTLYTKSPVKDIGYKCTN